MMQTDPNPANYLYDKDKNILNLIDFGSGRAFNPKFIDGYMDIVYGAFIENKERVWKGSRDIGFLTGEESKELLSQHYNGALTVAAPFMWQETELYDFGSESVVQNVYNMVPGLAKQTLTPPPKEVYALHRKILGTYLICMRLRARVPARKLFLETYDIWKKNLKNKAV